MRIEVAGATKRFGRRVVFEDLTFQVLPGRICALVGPSGSGKSTLLAVMAGLCRLDRGSVRWVSPKGWSGPPHPDRVSWIPQGTNALASRTALDNVMLGPLSQGATVAQARAVSEAALARLDLLHLRSVRVSKVSGGELQRVCFARVVSAGLPCVFADEPSSNLDASSTRVLASGFRALAHRDVSLVIATHDPDIVAAADDVVLLRDRP